MIGIIKWLSFRGPALCQIQIFCPGFLVRTAEIRIFFALDSWFLIQIRHG